jgi:hypothetical protein
VSGAGTLGAVTRSLAAVLRGAVLLIVAGVGSATAVHAQDSTVPDGSVPPASLPAATLAPGEVAAPATPGAGGSAPLVIVPTGCVTPAPPDIVFIGTLVDRDYRTGRFRIDQVRDGDAARFSVDGLVDVRYGNDVQYLELGDEYLVGAGIHPDLGVLVSQIRAPAPAFGGDEVIGVAESDVPCPVLEDPVRTFLPDGTSVESGVLAPFFEDRPPLAGAFLIPLGVVFAAVFVLAAIRLILNAVVRGVGAMTHRR